MVVLDYLDSWIIESKYIKTHLSIDGDGDAAAFETRSVAGPGLG